MFDNLQIFRMAQGLASHSAARTAAIAENIANADTPGYRAHDLKSFEASYRSDAGRGLRVTRAAHVFEGKTASTDLADARVERPGAMSPNGNNVSIEKEMMEASAAKGQHDRALAVYKTALSILRTAANGGR